MFRRFKFVFVSKTIQKSSQKLKNKSFKPILAGSLVSLFMGSFLLMAKEESDTQTLPKVGIPRPDLKNFSKEEIAKHKTKETGIWVTYKEGVYDITQFADEHPGGAKILLAAGGAIDAFWQVYATHHQKHVYETLEKHRIGNYIRVAGDVQHDSRDPYASEPERNPAMLPNSVKPWVAEAIPEILAGNFVTPNDLHYVRNHLPVPVVDVKKYRLVVKGLNGDVTYTLNDLKKFPKHTVTCTLQCMGNRRNEMKAVQDIRVVGENNSMISNSVWSGVRLKDFLAASGLEPDSTKFQHVQFESIDRDPTGAPFGSSIPISKALDHYGDVILAYEMNGVELPRDHGYPVRMIIPGHAGNKNVKWLDTIILSEKESANWGFDFYREYPKYITNDKEKTWSPVPQIMPINSAILIPQNGVEVDQDLSVDLKGWAFSGGGRGVTRVEVSTDGGKTWTQTEMDQSNQPFNQRWSWTLWTHSIDVPQDHNGKVDVMVRAVDDQSNKQPSSMEDIWNMRGINCNAWHKISLKVKKDE